MSKLSCPVEHLWLAFCTVPQVHITAEQYCLLHVEAAIQLPGKLCVVPNQQAHRHTMDLPSEVSTATASCEHMRSDTGSKLCIAQRAGSNRHRLRQSYDYNMMCHVCLQSKPGSYV